MYLIAGNQLIEIIDLLAVIQSLWNGMVPLLVGMIGHSFQLWSWSWCLWSWSCINGRLHHWNKSCYTNDIQRQQ